MPGAPKSGKEQQMIRRKQKEKGNASKRPKWRDVKPKVYRRGHRNQFFEEPMAMERLTSTDQEKQRTQIKGLINEKR